jgi:hypothetical protein
MQTSCPRQARIKLEVPRPRSPELKDRPCFCESKHRESCSSLAFEEVDATERAEARTCTKDLINGSYVSYVDALS